jgi:hypothetical protein
MFSFSFITVLCPLFGKASLEVLISNNNPIIYNILSMSAR